MAPCARAGAVVVFEAQSEVKGIFKTNLSRNMPNRFLGKLQQLAGPAQALHFKVALGSLADLGAK